MVSSVSNTPLVSQQQSLTRPLLSGGAYSPQVLSLLQQNKDGTFDPISTILGGKSNANPLTSLYTNLFSTNVYAAYREAITQGQEIANAPKAVTTTDALISDLSKASIAYNQRLVAASQAYVKENAYKPDGVNPLIA